MKTTTVNLILLSIFTSFAMAGHHEEQGPQSHASAEWQIKAYSSAAPDYLGDLATVIGGDGKVLKQGANGWTCQSAKRKRRLVERSRGDARVF